MRKLRYDRVKFFNHCLQVFKYILFRILFRCNVASKKSVYFFFNHVINIFTKVFAKKHLTTLCIELFTLNIHHIIIFKNAFSYIKVICFHFFLCRLNLSCDKRVFNSNILFNIQSIHKTCNLITAKNSHKVIFKR